MTDSKTNPTDALLARQRPAIMGILNATPDSFSDGGRFQAVDAAVAHALAMVEQGADIIDIGGESTRPGSVEVAEAEERDRVVPIIEALAPELPTQVAISIDTRSPAVARAALAAGAHLINDVNGARAEGMLETAAEFAVPIVLMHMQGKPQTMQDNPYYDDPVAEILDFLNERAEAATAVGIPPHRVVLDVGIGFGKRREDNLALLAHLDRFTATGHHVLLGTSRKRFMGAICNETEPTELLGATCATTALGVDKGVQWFRVHDVKPNRQAADVAWALKEAAQENSP